LTVHLGVVSKAFLEQQRFFAWEVFYLLATPTSMSYLVLLRYLALRERGHFSATEIAHETGKNSHSMAKQLSFLCDHACLIALASGQKTRHYRVSDFGLCVVSCIAGNEQTILPQLEAEVMTMQQSSALRTHRKNQPHLWDIIDPLIEEDIDQGKSGAEIAKHLDIPYSTLHNHMKKKGMIVRMQQRRTSSPMHKLST
jgi:hypothetical protein